jgi:hypothetical protein
MRQARASLFVIALLALAGMSRTLAEGDVNLLLGGREMIQSTDWKPYDSQLGFGLMADFGRPTWPIQLEAAYLESKRSVPSFGSTQTVEFSELCFGFGKYWSAGRKTRPYIGAGGEYLTVTVNRFGSAASAESFGTYVHAGVFRRIGRRFNLGVDGRIVTATSNDTGRFTVGLVEPRSPSYAQLGMILGWGWPA